MDDNLTALVAVAGGLLTAVAGLRAAYRALRSTSASATRGSSSEEILINSVLDRDAVVADLRTRLAACEARHAKPI